MDLARATKQNLTDFFRFLGHSPAADYQEMGGIARWRTPLAHPWFNGILLRRPPRAGDEALLAQLVAEFQFVPDTPFTLWIEHDTPRDPWSPILSSLGFVHDHGAPGMAITLRDLPPQAALPPGFAILPVTDNRTLRIWSETFISAYELPAHWAIGLYALLEGLGLNIPLAHFLGTLDGKAVATSSIFYSAGVAGVQFVATMPTARRRGLGGFMTLQPLYEAHRQGVTAAILQSSEMGYNLYKDVGFQHVANVDNEFRPNSDGRPAHRS